MGWKQLWQRARVSPQNRNEVLEEIVDGVLIRRRV